VEIVGSSHRNRTGFEQEFEKMAQSFEKKLQTAGRGSQESEGPA